MDGPGGLCCFLPLSLFPGTETLSVLLVFLFLPASLLPLPGVLFLFSFSAALPANTCLLLGGLEVSFLCLSLHHSLCSGISCSACSHSFLTSHWKSLHSAVPTCSPALHWNLYSATLFCSHLGGLSFSLYFLSLSPAPHSAGSLYCLSTFLSSCYLSWGYSALLEALSCYWACLLPVCISFLLLEGGLSWREAAVLLSAACCFSRAFHVETGLFLWAGLPACICTGPFLCTLGGWEAWEVWGLFPGWEVCSLWARLLGGGAHLCHCLLLPAGNAFCLCYMKLWNALCYTCTCTCTCVHTPACTCYLPPFLHLHLPAPAPERRGRRRRGGMEEEAVGGGSGGGAS